MEEERDLTKKEKKPFTPKRILALCGVALLVLLYLATLILALLGYGFSSDLFGIAVIATILVPIVLFILIFLIERGRNS